MWLQRHIGFPLLMLQHRPLTFAKQDVETQAELSSAGVSTLCTDLQFMFFSQCFSLPVEMAFTPNALWDPVSTGMDLLKT